MVVQSQLLMLRGVPITKWLSLRMLVEIALVVNFKGSAYRVRAAHWVHDHSWRTGVAILSQELNTALASTLRLSINLGTEFWGLVVYNMLMLCVNHQKRAFFFTFFVRGGTIKFFTDLWMRWTEIVYHRVVAFRNWLRLSVGTPTVLNTPRSSCWIHWFIRFWVLLARRLNEISIEVVRKWLLHLGNIHFRDGMRSQFRLIWVLHTPLTPQVCGVIMLLGCRLKKSLVNGGWAVHGHHWVWYLNIPDFINHHS